MEIYIKHVGKYVDVEIVAGDTTVSLGMLNEREVGELVGTLIEALRQLAPEDYQ